MILRHYEAVISSLTIQREIMIYTTAIEFYDCEGAKKRGIKSRVDRMFGERVRVYF